MPGAEHGDQAPQDWQAAIHRLFRDRGLTQVAYVPDAGHKTLIELCRSDETIKALPLTTEEEGIALLAGAWLGGAKGALLMQSSGVGNCINMLSLTVNGRFPLVMLVTMRGQWEEFNPWQVPMAEATRPVLGSMKVSCRQVDAPDEVVSTVKAAIDRAYGQDEAVAVLLSQRLIGRKKW
jgi:sulfopyruvate decarboxylase alpha subunit